MIKVAITGPESSGKTTLSEALAKRLNALAVEEYARVFLTETKGKYTQSDLDHIGVKHLENIQLSQNSTNNYDLMVVDTDFVVLKVWSEYKYNNTSVYVNELVAQDHFDLHILCRPDIPWEEDVLRENPEDRDVLFAMYENVLNDRQKNMVIVEGDLEARIKKAIEAIALLKK